jgi:hypothetical protein
MADIASSPPARSLTFNPRARRRTNIRIYWPDFYTEYHKDREQGEVLAKALEREGVYANPDEADGCQLLFCGSFFRYGQLKKERERYGKLPIVHYSWDIYPWQIEDEVHSLSVRRWAEYLDELRLAHLILVPSHPQIARHKQYVRHDANVAVCKCSMRPFEPACTVYDGRYVVDVMRKNPDPNRDIIRKACDQLGIECREPSQQLSWDDYCKTICGATLLCCGHYECSTGGLSLMEGHWLGKPVLLARSPCNGAYDYWGIRAAYFQWDSWEDVLGAVQMGYEQPERVDITEARSWLTQEYSDAAFAHRLAGHFRSALGWK